MTQPLCFALGARDGDALAQLRLGLDFVEARGIVLEGLSSLWETEPVDLPPGKPVLNAAATGRTSLTPLGILAVFQAAEALAGRRRGARPWRSLDLDILLLGDARLSLPGLEIPHPRFHARRFNLCPLAEVAASAVHPVLGTTVAGLLEACRDGAWARPVLRDWAGRAALHRHRPSGKIPAFPGLPNVPGTPPSP